MQCGAERPNSDGSDGGPRKQFERLPRKDTWVASKKRQAGGQSAPRKVKNKRREREVSKIPVCCCFLLRIQLWMSSSN